MRFAHPFMTFAGGIFVLLLVANAQADTLAVSVDFSPVAISESAGFVDVAGGSSATLSSEPGQPRLPRQIVSYALPPDADLSTVSVTVDGAESIDLPLDRPVRPAPPWRTSADSVPFYGSAQSVVDGKDMAVYGRDAFVPDSRGRLGDRRALPPCAAGEPTLASSDARSLGGRPSRSVRRRSGAWRRPRGRFVPGGVCPPPACSRAD